MASATKEEEDIVLEGFGDDLQQSPPRALSKAEEEELAQIKKMIADGDMALKNAGIDPDDTEHMDNLNAPYVRPANEERARDDAAYRALMEYLRKRPFKAKSRPYITKKTPKGGSRRRTRSRGNRRKSRRTKRRTRRRTRRSRK